MSEATTPYRVDRSTWAAGPWDREPEDKIEFRHAGMPCMLVRGPAGAWCGYVGVPAGHPLYGHGWSHDGVSELSVHGGITYAERCQADGPICHAPPPGEPDDVWWLGFDCNHAGDVAPKNEREWRDMGKPTGWGTIMEYRSSDYARRETERLADQIAGLA